MKKIVIIFLSILFFIPGLLQAQSWQWAKQMGSSYLLYDDLLKSLISDGNHTYGIGTYAGIFNLPSDTIYSNGLNDIFIAKFANNGVMMWAKTLGGSFNQPTANEYGNGVYDPVNDCIYLTGTFIGYINFGNGISLNSLNTDQDIFISKMDLNGNFHWAKKIESQGHDYAYIFAKPDGNILISGHLENNSFVDTVPIVAGGFFASYDSLGNILWAKHKMNGPDQYQVSIDFIDNDFVIAGVAGPSGTVTIDTVTMNVNGLYDGFLARFDSVANLKYLKIIGGKGVGAFNWISIDANKNIYCAGSIMDSVIIGNDTLFHPVSDYIVAKFDENANLLWYRMGNSSLGAESSYILCNSEGKCYVSGAFQGNLSFGSNNLSANTNQNMFVTRIDENGNWYDVLDFGEANPPRIVVDSIGSLYVAGEFKNTINVGSTSMTSSFNNDIYLAKSSAITGLEENQRNSFLLLNIYANPNAGKCTITIPEEFKNEHKLLLSIYDINGRIILQKSLLINTTTINVDLEAVAKGVYSVNLSNGKKTYSGKIVLE